MHPITRRMEQTHDNLTDGTAAEFGRSEAGETGANNGNTGARVVELAQKVRLAQRTAAEFMRRWAVEQAVEEVGLVALRDGSIDLPSQSHWLDALAGQNS